MTDLSLKARPTIYKGTRMRSRLEAGFAGWLDQHDREWEYEPFAVGDEHGQYLPDFLVPRLFVMPGPTSKWGDVYVEVKPSMGSVDWDRMHRAAVQLAPTRQVDGRDPLLVVVAPKSPPLIVWSRSDDVGEGAWVYGDTSSGCKVALSLSAGAPFDEPWWT